ncbi:MAG: carbon-nitrogen hydrolase family protein [Candidatus Binatia bacterium]
MSVSHYIAAAIQLCAGSDKVENLAKVEALVEQAVRTGARLVVLPEVFLWRGPRGEEGSHAEPIPGPSTARLAELARRHQLHLLAGSILEQTNTDKVFNTSLLFDPRGELVGRYRKTHLFDIDLPGHVTIRESDTRAAGSAAVTVATELGVIGMTICYDLRFPELYRRLTLDGAEIVAIPSAFTFPTGAAHWEILVRARAIENQLYVIAPDQVGPSPSGHIDFGGSLIVDPWGKPLAHASDRETVIFAEIDRDYQRKVRHDLPCLEHIRFAQ